MINRIIRYFEGYLRIRISGNTVERFINTCSHKGIYLWNLVSSHSEYEMNITISDFKKLKPVIRKTRTKVVVVKRAGFPFFIQRYHRRKIFFAGFLICLALIYILSNYIWNINITGNSMYTTENLISFLDSIDIKRGIKRSDIKCTEINRKIRQNYNDIIWVSASLEGSNLNIEIKENEDSKEITRVTDNTETTPYDIVASEACRITKIVVRNGITNVKEGNYVKKGDLLVSGQIPVYNDAKEIINYQYCISDADIYGQRQIIYTDNLPVNSVQKNFHNIEKHEYFLQIGNYRFTIGGIKNDYQDYETYSMQKKTSIFSWGHRSARPYTTTSEKYTDAKIQEILSSNFHHYCRELEKKGVVILQNDVKIYTWSDKAIAKGTLTIEMPIGQKVKAELIEIGDKIDGNDGNND